jgi:hypothetical protein
MKIIILSLLLTGCTTLTDKMVKPTITEDNYWKIPCIWDGTVLKKPWLKKNESSNQ